MIMLPDLLNLILHVDTFLAALVSDYGLWVYALLFLIIFLETVLVVTPFLPGDSLLFTVGVLAAAGLFNIWLVFGLLAVAAILGDTINYWIGAKIGPRAFSGKYRFLRRDYLDAAHSFYEKHGRKTVVLARFVPLIRTFAPFVAGIG